MNYCWMCNRYWILKSNNLIDYYNQGTFHIAISIDKLCPICDQGNKIYQKICDYNIRTVLNEEKKP